ncbi:hypothetical protein [Actinomadura sp. 3N508]|uniref:hypothetical protein n=1 Tax=Actinomadura sp. 3N508 TaxID=3375153 RepID=UPI0037BD2AC3
MLTVARAALYAVVPAEVIFAVLLVAGVPLPRLVVVTGEALVTAVIALEAIAAGRLVWERRRDGAGWGDALRSVNRLVPERVRRIMAFDMKGLVSVVLLVVRRRHGVPPGAVGLPYAGGQLTLQLAFLFAMVVEAAVAEMLLRGVGAAEGVRSLVLVVDLYSILVVVAIIAACVTRPHVLSDDELRVRYGAFFDLRVPRDLLSSVRVARNFNESGMVRVEDERLSVAVASQTNVVVELSEPIVAVRPLGKRVTVRTVRFFTDDPTALVNALTETQN